MKKIIYTSLTFSLIFISSILIAQPQGQWTWMNGANTTGQAGVYGTQGVFAPGNTPPSLYEAVQWTDHAGNFWIFGGLNYSDLWEFKPSINQWAWMKGPGTAFQLGTYGTQNVASPLNNPGGRAFASYTFVDNNGDLWLFGGYGYDGVGGYGYLNDLWKYSIASNEWTWVSGSNLAMATATYGTMGVAAPGNVPGGRCESNASWCDNNNNLWVFGGMGLDNNTIAGDLGDLWMYNIGTNEWTWVNGPNTINQNPGVYGTIGVANPANRPSCRMCYASWKSQAGDLWLFGGVEYNSTGNYRNDLWKWDIAAGMWTWMSGTSNANDPGNYGAQCASAPNYCPSGRGENRACWTRGCDNFVNFGGSKDLGGSMNQDLWDYSLTTGKWTLMSGTSAFNGAGNFGTITVSSITNMPPSRMGSDAFVDNAGNLWMFGGWAGAGGFYNDMWRFVPDTTCPAGANGNVIAAFTPNPDTACNPGTITFTNNSSNATSYQWNFGDGNTDTVANPVHTFNTIGLDTVTLIAISNGACATGSDTIQVTIFIVTPPIVNLGNDTTLCIGQTLTLNAANPGDTYLWSTGATTQTIVADSTANYWVTVSAGSCTVTDSILVTFITHPVVNLGNDTTLCSGQPITLDAGNPGDTYLWSNGAVTETISPTTTGTYWVVVSLGTCTGTDSINLNFLAVPIVNLGPDQSICNGNSVTLNAGNPGDTYLWSTGAATQTITVSAAGTYYVQVQNGTCTGTDTIVVNANVSPIVNLGPDLTLCNGMDTALNAGNAGMNYHWSNGETSQRIIISTSGTYWVQVDNNGCIGSDTAMVTIAPPLTVNLGPDTVICPGDQMTIDAGTGYASYSWIPGGQSTHYIIINQPGTYGITVIDTNGCIARTSIWVDDFCPSDLYIPSAFAPDGNNLNGLFMAYGENIMAFHMYVFNRWGQQIFDSEDISKGWDGTFNGNPVPQDTYVYRVDYQLYDYTQLHKHSKVGTVTLIR